MGYCNKETIWNRFNAEHNEETKKCFNCHCTCSRSHLTWFVHYPSWKLYQGWKGKFKRRNNEDCEFFEKQTGNYSIKTILAAVTVRANP